MAFQDFCSQPMTTKEKLRVGIITIAFALMGAGLGVTAYYQQWLG